VAEIDFPANTSVPSAAAQQHRGRGRRRRKPANGVAAVRTEADIGHVPDLGHQCSQAGLARKSVELQVDAGL
jgi:hypothetical protein